MQSKRQSPSLGGSTCRYIHVPGITPLRYSSLVNNAGVALEARHPARIHETEESTWDTTMRVNAKSVFLGCKYGIAQMLKQEPHSCGDRGWIINIASIFGIIAGLHNGQSIGYLPDVLLMNTGSYCASKAAVSNLTRQVALDYAPDRIHVNALCPGCTFAINPIECH